MGNLLARARVINASSLFAYAEVLVEDNEGRQIAHGGGHAAIVSVDPVPPPPPTPLEQIEEPTWATPDPWQRPAGASVPLSLWDTTNGVDILAGLSTGALRASLDTLFDWRIQHVSRGRLTATGPASVWFCNESRTVPVTIIATLAELAGWECALTMHRAGETMAGLDVHMRFFHPVVADGRPIRAEARHDADGDGVFVISTTVYDADGTTVATSNASGAPIDNTRRKRTRRRPAERMLCTILFTDIVDSTARAESLGDIAWGSLLGRHHETARREIAHCQGREVKSTGDGLLVRFSSPARALDCATRMRRSLAALGIEIRAGLHTGECEVTDEDIVGLAVHVAARIQAAASPGQVLVSSTVKDLAAGAGYQFENRGEHELKGVEEPWRLWSVS
jgi:class 3 adenylate cyclase